LVQEAPVIGRVGSVLVAASAVAIVIALPGFAWPKGSAGGAASGGHGSTGGTGHSASRAACIRGVGSRAQSASAFGSAFVTENGAVSAQHGIVGGEVVDEAGRSSLQSEATSPESSHDSDLGPWIIFLWMEHGISGAVHWISG
jgi:hypothetical protein